MKIVIVAHILRQSSGRYVERLLYHLQKIDSKNRYVVLLKPEDYAGWVPQSPNFTKLQFSFKRYSLIDQVRLAKLLYRQNADVVHFSFQPDVFTPLAGLFYFRKKVFTIHDLTQLRIKNRKRGKLSFEILHWGFKLMIRLNAWASQAIIVPSKFVKFEVKNRLKVNSKKIFVTYEAADKMVSGAPKSIEELAGKRFVLYVGTAHAHKNLDRLVDSFALVAKQLPQTKLVLTGKKDVFYSKLEKRVIQRGYADEVMFTDFVSDAQLAWLYQNASAYVFPSLSEGFGLPGLEAMQYGLPVISSKATCLPEIYGEAAIYFDPQDKEGMAQQIIEVLTRPSLSKRLSLAGQHKVKQYSWEKMADETLDVYRAVRG